MKIDFSQPLTDLEGKPMQMQANGASRPLTLGLACCEALLAPSDDKADGATKVRQYKLALIAYGGVESEIEPEDAALLKTCIARVYAPLVVGRAYELLNG